MSRRKQAKPRACLKLGEKEEDAEAAMAPSASDLLEPKEELLSAEESGEEDEPAESQPERQQSWPSADEADEDATTTTAKAKAAAAAEEEEEELQHPGEAAAVAAVASAEDATTANGHCKSSSVVVVVVGSEADVALGQRQKQKQKQLDMENAADDGEEEELDEDLSDDDLLSGEEDYDDEELQSLDSFYSDMYSTHTSSSYSPSISDGTLTPNSHILPAPQSQSQSEEPPSNDPAGHTNGEGVSEEPVSKPRRPAQLHHHHHHYHHQQALKLANKLRKINKEAKLQASVGAGEGTGAGAGAGTGAGATKFDKLTGEGIKSRSDGSYQCQFCDKSFPRLGYLKHHVQSHAEHLPFKCEYCAKLFKHKRSRDRHKKLHTNERNYKCPHCEAAFSRSDHLKIHMKTHDIQKPFQCSMCNRGYNTAAALTSHMQKHKKNAAILAAGGNPNALNYSPRSTGSASVSSNGSLHKRRYALALASDSSPSRLEFPKRARQLHNASATPTPLLRCSYCPRAEFSSLEQLNGHLQSVHEQPAPKTPAPSVEEGVAAGSFQLSCEYCTMKFGNIAALFQHMRATHLDRLTSPNSYYEHFNRLATAGTFSPRLALEQLPKIKQDPLSPKEKEEEEPTDLSSNKRNKSPQLGSPKPIPIPIPASSSCSSSAALPGVFFCNQCNAGLPDFESFRNHLKSHIAEGLQLSCPHCGLTLPDPPEYERHVVGHFLIANSEFNCSASCSKSYAKAEDLQQHLLSEHVITLLKCALCSELCENQVQMQLHLACAHTQETKLLRCSACMELFRSETDFHVHVKTRHQLSAAHPTSNNNNNGNNNGNGNNNVLAPTPALQCMFCRVVCASELEMHFHLAAHARQFRCPSCPETFHVEFLLDRHMQNQHGGQEQSQSSDKDSYEEATPPTPSTQLSPMNSLYVNALFRPPSSNNNNNNSSSLLDYNVAFAAAQLQQQHKGLFAPPPVGKFYSPLQVDTNALKTAPSLVYAGLSQRYFDTNRALMEMYAAQQQKSGNYFAPSPKSNQERENRVSTEQSQPSAAAAAPVQSQSQSSLSCGMCERQDFRSEAELLSHRKIAHNMKTGVSLRCAYCAGNFKSRSELEHHMKTCHNSTGKHKCLICDEVFPSPAILAEHKLQHSKVGQSGKCSHCGRPLNDVAAFKAHLGEHQPNSNNNNNAGALPLPCICCRQTLHSEFEVSLHAKFHTKASSSLLEPTCALCLEPLASSHNNNNNNGETPSPAKVCEKCCRKHNLNLNLNLAANPKRKSSAELAFELPPTGAATPFIENRCNLCKMILPHAAKLQEHLVEHTFAGTEERGFNCYICSAVFTAPSGLLSHMAEHGANSRPYDCNLCTEKFFFRAELDHHQRAHELRPTTAPANRLALPKQEPQPSSPAAAVKQEIYEEAHSPADAAELAPEEEEYIEVEQVPSESRAEVAAENAELRSSSSA